jgi:hypothetical protein
MPRIREDKVHRRARFRTNQRDQRRRRCVHHGGAGGVRRAHGREDGREEDPKNRRKRSKVSVQSSSIQFGSTTALRETLPKEIHRNGDEQTSVVGSGARDSEL